MTTLNVRNIDETAVKRIKLAAAARGMTVGDYLVRVSELHDVIRARADAGDDGLQAELESRGLQTVHR